MTERQLAPRDAVESYLDSRHDVVQSTLDNHKYRLGLFCDWCERAGIESPGELTGFHLQEYKNWRIDGEDAPTCGRVTLQQHIHTLRVFLRWCESVELVEDGLSEKVVVPTVEKDEQARDVAISHERAQTIIEYLADYRWASVEHIAFHVLYHTGMRRSGLHSLDVDDWHPEERYLQVEHRPDEGSRLKGGLGDREITVTDNRLASALDDYIADVRPDTVDEHGREPLMASTAGRMHATSIAKLIYKVTRPCYYTGECPIDREIESCEATSYDGYTKCPENVSPHPIRRSAITHALSQDVPKEIVSGRCAVSKDVLDLHYDERDQEQKRKTREQYLDDI